MNIISVRHFHAIQIRVQYHHSETRFKRVFDVWNLTSRIDIVVDDQSEKKNTHVSIKNIAQKNITNKN